MPKICERNNHFKDHLFHLPPCPTPDPDHNTCVRCVDFTSENVELHLLMMSDPWSFVGE